jgi:signal transduction histidine kinase
LSAEPIDLVTATREVIAEFEALAQSRGVSIELQASPTPMVSVRADAFRHILMNLLDNAVKYGPSEQTIRVSVLAANDRVTVSVHDEGPRVPASERDDIWRAFARGSTSTASGGSGIGLTIVRELAHAHGGTATLDTGVGVGNRFVLSFPVAGGLHPAAFR